MKHKVVLIGIDGATFDIMDELIAKGKLPNLNKIFSTGVKSRLFSSVPPISAPAWVSFLTGKNPGKHGILGFQKYNLFKYNCFDHNIVTSNSYEKNTIFDILTRNNKRSIAFQVPLTYPAWPINGIMVAGYPTPDQTKAFTFPENYSDKIGHLYEYKSDQIASGNTEEKIKIYSDSLERISHTVEDLLKNQDYDLFAYVNNTIDWVQHKFWKLQFNDNGNSNKVIDLFYIKLDEKIGDMLELIDDDTTVLVMSDHGAGKRPTKFFNINYFLRKKGFLTPTNKNINIFTKTNRYWFEWVKEFFPIRYWSKANFSNRFREKVIDTRVYKNNIDWENTKAYRVPLAYPFVGININLKNRQEKGIVKPGKEFKELKKSLFNILSEFSINNNDYITSVYRQEDFYWGPLEGNTPDLIVELNQNYDSGSEIDQLITDIPPALLTTISGFHRPYGIFGAMGKNIKNIEGILESNIMDITPTILYLLGLPVDDDMDGKVLLNIIDDNFKILNTPEFISNDDNGNSNIYNITEEDESKMMDSLCEMGYL